MFVDANSVYCNDNENINLIAALNTIHFLLSYYFTAQIIVLIEINTRNFSEK